MAYASVHVYKILSVRTSKSSVQFVISYYNPYKHTIRSFRWWNCRDHLKLGTVDRPYRPPPPPPHWVRACVVCYCHVCLHSKIPVQFYFIILHDTSRCMLIPPVWTFQSMLPAQFLMYSSGDIVDMSSFALFLRQLGETTNCITVSSLIPHNIHLGETGCISLFDWIGS